MKKYNRILAGVMAACLMGSVAVIPDSIAPVVSLMASAGKYEMFYYEVEDGEITITNVDNSIEDDVIPSEIEGLPVTKIGKYAFLYCEALTSVTIPDSVTIIEHGAFENCTSLTSVTIPESVTSIGEWAFSECTSLTSVTIPDSVTNIGKWAFGKCTSLTSVTIPDSVTSIGESAFFNCENITSITLPNNLASIEGYCFSGCGLTSVTIPESVKNIGKLAFAICHNLESVTLLNPECEIADNSSTLGSRYTVTIYGYENSTAQAYAEKYNYKFKVIGEAPEQNTATGDFNGDGDFNISDIVAFQKYLLGASDTEISDWKQADLNNDGLLDSFDLVLMRKKLIEKNP